MGTWEQVKSSHSLLVIFMSSEVQICSWKIRTQGTRSCPQEMKKSQQLKPFSCTSKISPGCKISTAGKGQVKQAPELCANLYLFDQILAFRSSGALKRLVYDQNDCIHYHLMSMNATCVYICINDKIFGSTMLRH